MNKIETIGSIDELLNKDYLLRINTLQGKRDVIEGMSRQQGRTTIMRQQLHDFFNYRIKGEDIPRERFDVLPDGHLSEIISFEQRKRGNALWLYDIGPVERCYLLDKQLRSHRAELLVGEGRDYANFLFRPTQYLNSSAGLQLSGNAELFNMEDGSSQALSSGVLMLQFSYQPTHKIRVLRVA